MQSSSSSSSSSLLSTRKRPRCVEPVTALDLWHRQQQRDNVATSSSQRHTALTTTAVALLQHPHWKLLAGTLNEVAGPAGVGKSQLALTMCADSVVLHQKALYVVLGGSSSQLGRLSQRLKTMLLARMNMMKHKETPEWQAAVANIHRMMGRVLLHWIRNTEDLMEFLQTSLPKLLLEQQNDENSSVRLVVLDGIAQLFRHDENGMTMSSPWLIERSGTFFELSNRCKRLADQYQIPFLVLNQATCRIKDNPPSASSAISSSSSRRNGEDNDDEGLEPALGLSWKQCVNASFFVTASAQANYRTSSSNNNNNNSEGTMVRRRRIRCLKAPHVPCQETLEFYIDHRGTVRICS